MTQQLSLFGTDSNKIIRTGAPDTSAEAGRRVDTTRDERRVYRLVKESRDGLTIKECARQMTKFPNHISGRFTGLQEKGLIRDSGKRREASRVMVVTNLNPTRKHRLSPSE